MLYLWNEVDMLDHLGQLPGLAAKKFGNKEALNFENRSFSFIEINSLVENLASNLKNLSLLEQQDFQNHRLKKFKIFQKILQSLELAT